MLWFTLPWILLNVLPPCVILKLYKMQKLTSIWVRGSVAVPCVPLRAHTLVLCSCWHWPLGLGDASFSFLLGSFPSAFCLMVWAAADHCHELRFPCVTTAWWHCSSFLLCLLILLKKANHLPSAPNSLSSLRHSSAWKERICVYLFPLIVSFQNNEFDS